MIISVASGKGGTGKTTIAVNLALSLNKVQFLDCDVEEPNAHIFLKPEIKGKKAAYIPIPEIDEGKCNYCGKCGKVCAYNAIAVIAPSDGNKKGNILIFPHLCHGCGACSFFCPQKAIKEVNKEIGVIEIGEAQGIQFIHGKLNIGEAMSPPLIRQVKEYINPTRTVIIDAPPGTSCPVITSVKGSDFSILVTEPTPFGLNDLILTVEVIKKLKVPFGIVINRADLGNNKTEEYCKQENIPVLLKIPFKKEIAVAYSKGDPIVKVFPKYRKDFQNLFNTIHLLFSTERYEANSYNQRKRRNRQNRNYGGLRRFSEK
jgi:MinD superfamily P-loop ATPase